MSFYRQLRNLKYCYKIYAKLTVHKVNLPVSDKKYSTRLVQLMLKLYKPVNMKCTFHDGITYGKREKEFMPITCQNNWIDLSATLVSCNASLYLSLWYCIYLQEQ